MMPRNAKRGPAAWAAVLSVLLNALWPLLAVASLHAPDSFGAELCSVTGSRAATDPRQSPAPVDPLHRLVPHCEFCSLGPGHAAFHSAEPLVSRLERPLHAAPAGYRSAILPWFLPASVKSRSPPA